MLQNVADFLLRFVKDEFYPILCYIQPHRWRNCVSCSLGKSWIRTRYGQTNGIKGYDQRLVDSE